MSQGGFDPGAAVSSGSGNAFGNTGGSGTPGDFQIYVMSGQAGDLAQYDGGSINAFEYGGKSHLVPVSASAYADQYLNSISTDPQKISALQQQLAKAGYNVDASGMLDQKTLAAYMALLQDVSVANGAGNLIGPDDYLQQKIAGLGGANGGGQTQTSTSFTNPVDARAAALSAFESELGRKPTQKQLDAFYNALHAYEAANPSVTSESGGSNNSITSSGGAGSPADFAQQYVDQNFGAEAGNTSALHYFDIIANTLSGPPGAHEVV